MHEPVLILSITTPQTWAQHKPVRRRPAPRAVRKNVLDHKMQAVQARKEEPQMINAMQCQMEKSLVNGPLLDPTRNFPIPTSESVSQMVQYFVQIWAVQHGTAFAVGTHTNPYLSLLWPFALTSDMYFEALVAFSRAAFLISAGQTPRDDHQYISHRGNVMIKLRARLQDPEKCSDDATILTVISLGTIEYMLGDHSAAKAHVSGMRQIVKVRGGVTGDTPWDRLLKSNLNAYESLWSFLFTAGVHTDDLNQHRGQDGKNVELPIYMAHPFKPEVCTMLAQLPHGFCDLGLTGNLSLQAMRLLGDLLALRNRTAAAAEKKGFDTISRRKLQTTLEDLHRLSTMQTTQIERYLLHALAAYCYLLRLRYFDDHVTGFYETTLKALTASALKQKPSSECEDRKCYIWATTMIGTLLQHAQIRPDGWTTVFRMVLDQYNADQPWKQLEKDLKTFFFHEEIRAFVESAYDEAIRRRDTGNSEERDSRVAKMAIRNVVL